MKEYDKQKKIPRRFVLWYKRVPLLEVGFVDLLLLIYTLSAVCEEYVSRGNIAVPQLRFYKRSADHILPCCLYVQGCRMSAEAGSPCITRRRSALRYLWGRSLREGRCSARWRRRGASSSSRPSNCKRTRRTAWMWASNRRGHCSEQCCALFFSVIFSGSLIVPSSLHFPGIRFQRPPRKA